MFSELKVDSMEPGREPETLMPKEENPACQDARQAQPLGASMRAVKRLKDTQCIGVRDALFEAILDRVLHRPDA